MIQPDPIALRNCLNSLPIPADIKGPVFAEPWEAQAFAIAVHLSEKGYFTWNEWVSAFSAELSNAIAKGEPDDGSNYYHHWMTTLERIVSAKGLANLDMLKVRKDEWISAYLNTAHGQPVELNISAQK